MIEAATVQGLEIPEPSIGTLLLWEGEGLRAGLRERVWCVRSQPDPAPQFGPVMGTVLVPGATSNPVYPRGSPENVK